MCVGWQVTLCYPIWQISPHSSELDSHEELYTPLSFFIEVLTSHGHTWLHVYNISVFMLIFHMIVCGHCIPCMVYRVQLNNMLDVNCSFKDV